MAILLFDIGGTKTRLAISRDGKEIAGAKAFPTQQDIDAQMEAVRLEAAALSGGEALSMAVGGVAAMFDAARGSIHFSPQLPAWSGTNIRAALEAAADAPVVLENDAALAGLGEAHRGAGKGRSIMMYMTVSTGVGGSRIVDGRIDRKVFDFEPGQQVIDAGRTLESLISGMGIERRSHSKPQDIPQSDPMWHECALHLATGVANSVVHWQPDTVVLGGPMIIGAPAIPLEAVEQRLRELLHFYPAIPAITKAALGDLSGLHGALLLASSISR